jgi:superfamily I DNA/RNA helicase
MSLSSQMEFPLDHFRNTREAKGLHGEIPPQSRIEILSMWKSKGREFDFVILIFDPRELSQTTPQDTERRLIYVGATRAKEWLGVVYPHGSPGVSLAAILN